MDETGVETSCQEPITDAVYTPTPSFMSAVVQPVINYKADVLPGST